MSTGTLLAAVLPVLADGVLMCSLPAVTRSTLQFGVRVPRERAGAPVIRRARRAYYWRTAASGACCTALAVTVQGYGSWLPRIILVLELAAGYGCFLVARRKIAAVKNADNWFAGLRQTVVADTSWRNDPPRFPVRWLIPALAVMVATAVVGVLRYRGLPDHTATGFFGRRVSTSAVSAMVVAGQLYFTTVLSGLMLIVHRSRPDIEAADPAASALRYRRFLAVITRAVLIMAALADLGLLLIALPDWQVYRLSGIGRALPVVPFAAGVLLLGAVAARMGQGGSRLNGNVRGLALADGTDRDDDRFWKAGLVYVNRDDPALVVAARFGVGWMLNYGNPVAWLLIAGLAAWWAGLAVFGAAAGL